MAANRLRSGVGLSNQQSHLRFSGTEGARVAQGGTGWLGWGAGAGDIRQDGNGENNDPKSFQPRALSGKWAPC